MAAANAFFSNILLFFWCHTIAFCSENKSSRVSPGALETIDPLADGAVGFLPAAPLTIEFITALVASDPEAVTPDVKAVLKSNGGMKYTKIKESVYDFMKAIPIDKSGVFSEPVVRYVVHTFFARRYGWHIVGVDPVGRLWNSSSIMKAAIMAKLPDFVRDVMAERLEKTGFTADEITMLLTIVELLMDAEAVHRLRVIFEALQLPLNAGIPDNDIKTVLTWYVGLYMPGVQLSVGFNKSHLERVVVESKENYPSFDQLVGNAMQLSLEQNAAPNVKNARTFDDLSSLVRMIGYRIGMWQNNACEYLKTGLNELQGNGTGRVFLSDFYRANVEKGMWQFAESLEYLKSSGSLDEAIPGQPRIITSNWIWGPSNCMVTTGTHDACCIAECDVLRVQIERQVAAPFAAADVLAAIIANLSSSTRPAMASLKPEWENRLANLAGADDGLIPIYGRLFLQWLHHVYPNECPFPHVAGASSPENIFKFEAEHAGRGIAGMKDMSDSLKVKRRNHEPVISAPWVNQEELVARRQAVDDHPLGGSVVRLMVVCASMALAVTTVARSTYSVSRGNFDRAKKNQMDVYSV